MTPDFSRGLCVPGRLPALAGAWDSEDPELREAAMFACQACPVLSACDDWALVPRAYAHADRTILAGMTPKERILLAGLTPDQRKALRALAGRRQADERRAAVVAELVRDPRRGDRVTGLAAGVSRRVVSDVRGELEAAGVIGMYRATPHGPGQPSARPRSAARTAARAQLLADPSQSNAQAAVAAGTNRATVMNVRHELEAAGVIGVYRGRPGGSGLAVPA